MTDTTTPISKALEDVRQAQERYALMLRTYDRLERKEGVGSKAAHDFTEAVHDADNKLRGTRERLANTPAADAEEILLKVAALIEEDEKHNILFPIKAEIEELLGKGSDQQEANDDERPCASLGEEVMARLTARDLFLIQSCMRDLCDNPRTSEFMGRLAYDLHSEAWEALVTRDFTTADDALAAAIALFNDDEFDGVIHGRELHQKCVALIEQACGLTPLSREPVAQAA